jgi:hypothetical protein
MRIELLMSVLAGFAGGLVGTLWGGTVSMTLLDKLSSAEDGPRQHETLWRLLGGALLYGFGGSALGLLFWLGWGLVALVEAPWAVVGVAFALLCWTGAALPVLGMLQLRLRESRRVAVVLALEWFMACLAVGEFCALAWHRVV